MLEHISTNLTWVGSKKKMLTWLICSISLSLKLTSGETWTGLPRRLSVSKSAKILTHSPNNRWEIMVPANSSYNKVQLDTIIETRGPGRNSHAVARKSHDLARKSDDLARKSDGVAEKSHDLARKSDGMAGNRHDLVMLKVFDSLEHLMTGRNHFDRGFYHKLTYCMDWLSPQFLDSQNAAWAGFISYSDSNGVPGDRWGSNPSSFQERNVTFQRLHHILTMEPCNYASNVAYYHLVTATCHAPWSLPAPRVAALAMAAAGMAFGSAFFHASHTRLGQRADNSLIGVLSYILHQTSLEGLTSVPELTDLSPSPRPLSGEEISRKVTEMYRLDHVTSWKATLDSLDMPHYTTSFSALISTILSLALPHQAVDFLVPLLLDAFGLEIEIKSFILNKYLPQIKEKALNVGLNAVEKAKLFHRFLGSVKKIIYAFFWQEQTFDFQLFKDPLPNEIGASLLPLVNHASTLVYQLPYSWPSLQAGSGVYPGEGRCNRQQPHSKWHLESAAGLLDLFMLTDYVYKITTK